MGKSTKRKAVIRLDESKAKQQPGACEQFSFTWVAASMISRVFR